MIIDEEEKLKGSDAFFNVWMKILDSMRDEKLNNYDQYCVGTMLKYAQTSRT